jgi:hypothetical protein
VLRILIKAKFLEFKRCPIGRYVSYNFFPLF